MKKLLSTLVDVIRAMPAWIIGSLEMRSVKEERQARAMLAAARLDDCWPEVALRAKLMNITLPVAALTVIRATVRIRTSPDSRSEEEK